MAKKENEIIKNNIKNKIKRRKLPKTIILAIGLMCIQNILTGIGVLMAIQKGTDNTYIIGMVIIILFSFRMIISMIKNYVDIEVRKERIRVLDYMFENKEKKV